MQIKDLKKTIRSYSKGGLVQHAALCPRHPHHASGDTHLSLRPLSSEHGPHKLVKTRFWPWLEQFSVRNSGKNQVAPPLFGSGLATKHTTQLGHTSNRASCKKNNILVRIALIAPGRRCEERIAENALSTHMNTWVRVLGFGFRF